MYCSGGIIIWVLSGYQPEQDVNKTYEFANQNKTYQRSDRVTINNFVGPSVWKNGRPGLWKNERQVTDMTEKELETTESEEVDLLVVLWWTGRWKTGEREGVHLIPFFET